jgi:hypothetical protein
MAAMGRWARVLILSSFLSFPVAGCQELAGELVQVCMNCFEHDVEEPLSEAQVRSIVVDARVEALPLEARNVYFEEWCGIDCNQIFRFDLRSDTAHAVMQRFSRVEIAPLSSKDQRDLLRAPMEDPPPSWWLKAALPDADGVATDVNIGQLTEFILVPDRPVTRVYMRAFDM